MSDLPKKLGKRIAAERELQQISQAELAARIGVQPETISRIERGVFVPPLTRVESIAAALGLAMHDLLRFGSESWQDPLIQRVLCFARRRSAREVELVMTVVEAVLRILDERERVRT